jgi:hypothetical protein
MGGLMIHAALQESQTWDEGLHLTAGFSYWKTGDFRLNTEHPPLTKLLAAVPLLFTRATWPHLPEDWRNGRLWELFQAFVYRNTVDADTLLLLGRLPAIALALTLGLFLAARARQRWGAVAGLTAGALYFTDPNFIAHGHYITSDVPVTLAVLASALAWDRYLTSDRPRHFVAASLILGLALATKFSAVFLVPVHWLVYWLRRRPDGMIPAFLATAGAIVVVLLAYGPDSWRTVIGAKPSLASYIGVTESDYAGAILADFRLPAHPYLTGSWELFRHNREGHVSYLMGQVSEHGSMWYFPVAFAVKTPAAVLLLLLLIAIPVLAVSMKRVPVAAWLLALYPAAYLAMCLRSSLNLGLRHLLPLYPFLYLGIAWAVCVALSRRWRRPAILLLAAAGLLQTYELTRVHPHYTAFFNVMAGGPQNGHRYLVDSNLDWGQDLKKVKRWMDERGIENVCYSYFGSAPVEYYGLKGWTPGIPLETPDCMLAVSATNFYDVYFDPPRHRWLRERKPDAIIGHSTWIFDLRSRATVVP